MSAYEALPEEGKEHDLQILACRTGHRTLVAHLGGTVYPRSFDYLIATTTKKISLNMVDVEDPVFFEGVGLHIPFVLGLMDRHVEKSPDNRVVVLCDQGRSRSATMAFFYWWAADPDHARYVDAAEAFKLAFPDWIQRGLYAWGLHNYHNLVIA